MEGIETARLQVQPRQPQPHAQAFTEAVTPNPATVDTLNAAELIDIEVADWPCLRARCLMRSARRGLTCRTWVVVVST